MTLIINNDDVARLLTIEATMDALEQSYRHLAIGEAICRPRIDMRIPTGDPARTYQFGSMEGGSTEGYFAVRMKSDVIYETAYGGAITREKHCVRPGLFCGLIFLTSTETGEPLAFIMTACSSTCASRPMAVSGSSIWRERTPRWSACWVREAWRNPICRLSWQCDASGSCKCTVRPGRTARLSGARWRPGMLSRSYLAIARTTSTRGP